MKMYLAPMEGITGYVYRNALQKVFPCVDRYFTPFITPNQTHRLKTRELRDILPENNQGMQVIPQILTNRADEFVWTALKCRELGYNEVNLNLGCPSHTVVPKKRGAGFLAYPDELAEFLELVCEKLDQHRMGLSIKTRIGKFTPDEFAELLSIYNRFSLTELIVHPRVQTDYYKNTPNMEAFAVAARESVNPVCYNGDLFCGTDYRRIAADYPEVTACMFGRGVIANPNLIAEIKTGAVLTKDLFRLFHDSVFDGYQESIPEIRNVLFKMKELWSYIGCAFVDGKKYVKRIRKAENKRDYEEAVARLFAERELKESPRFAGLE